MCLAIPGKVIKITGRRATVEYPGETRKAMIGEDGIQVGDRVLVQMGIIIQRLGPGDVLPGSSVHNN